MILIPLAIFTREIGLYNSLAGLALVYAAVGIPWNVFFLRAFMETIPSELEEAAVLDGAGMWNVFRDVILPLSTPALATMATFHVLSAWSEFILALVLTGKTELAHPAGRRQPAGRPFHLERAGRRGGDGDHDRPGRARLHLPAAVRDQGLDRGRAQGVAGGEPSFWKEVEGKTWEPTSEWIR